MFGTRHLDSTERHEGMVAAIAFESVVKLVAFLAVGGFVTWGLFDGMADIWARAQAFPELRALLRLGGEGGAGSFGYAQWFALTLLSMLSVLLLPRQFQMMVVECVDERHLRRAAWVFPAYLLLINVFVLPIAIGGLLLFGPGRSDAETFVLSLPLAHGAPALALFAYVGGLSAATGMLIVETIAVSTMVCNDLVMPSLLRLPGFGARAGGDLTRLLLNIRRAAIVAVLLLGYLYFHIAGEAYALVSIGLISFAAVAQFAPALLAGMYWRGGTQSGRAGRAARRLRALGLHADAAVGGQVGLDPGRLRRARPVRHRAAGARAAVRPRRARQPDAFAVLEPAGQRRALRRPVAAGARLRPARRARRCSSSTCSSAGGRPARRRRSSGAAAPGSRT